MAHNALCEWCHTRYACCTWKVDFEGVIGLLKECFADRENAPWGALDLVLDCARDRDHVADCCSEQCRDESIKDEVHRKDQEAKQRERAARLARLTIIQ